MANKIDFRNLKGEVIGGKYRLVGFGSWLDRQQRLWINRAYDLSTYERVIVVLIDRLSENNYDILFRFLRQRGIKIITGGKVTINNQEIMYLVMLGDQERELIRLLQGIDLALLLEPLAESAPPMSAPRPTTEKASSEAAEKVARSSAERKVAEKAARERAERETAMKAAKAAKEKASSKAAKKDSKEKAKREAPAKKAAPRSLPWLPGFGILVSGVQSLIEKFKKTDQPEKSVEADEVSFTARYPKEGNVEKWYTLLVYAHIDTMIKEVRKDAMHFADQMGEPKESTTPTSTKLARGTEITIVPKCEGVTFNPEHIKLKWLGNYHRAVFSFRADKSLEGDAAKGYINIFVGPVIIGSLKFSMLITDKEISKEHRQEEHCSMYKKDKIFISYSHQDTDIVLAFKKVHEATGYDVLIDIDSLRSGQEWNSELMRMIDHADIFQLFWSKNSRTSKYCEQEWKHALKRDMEGFIRPLYWQKPLPNPPTELSKYHFEYVEL